MRLIFISALFLLPFIEIWGLFKFGSMYGWWFFLYIVVMAIPIQTSINNNFQDFKSNKPTTKDDAIEGEYRREED